MPNANRKHGDYLERSTRRALRAQGWVVTRSAGSLGPADLWAARDGNTLLMIACKVSGTMRPGERKAIRQDAAQGGARAVMATRPKRGWVELRLVLDGPEAPPIDMLKVPPEPRPGTRKAKANGDPTG